MLCIDNRQTDVYFNLAAEEYLLKSWRDDVFMLWQNEPSVIVGKHQEVFEEVNLNFAEEHGIKIARRFSGGGAVYHDSGNINLTFIETRFCADFDVYVQRIIAMLASLGVASSTDSRRAIQVGGLKISGSAQSIHKDRVLFHATLLVSADLQRLNASLESGTSQQATYPKRKVSVKSVKSPVTNLSAHLPAPKDMNEIKKYILNYYLTQNAQNKTYTFQSEDIASIEELRNIKYASKSWIYTGEFLKKQRT